MMASESTTSLLTGLNSFVILWPFLEEAFCTGVSSVPVLLSEFLFFSALICTPKKLMVNESQKCIILRRIAFLGSQLNNNAEYSFIDKKRGGINVEKGGTSTNEVK
jgi:hypothetical protein